MEKTIRTKFTGKACAPRLPVCNVDQCTQKHHAQGQLTTNKEPNIHTVNIHSGWIMHRVLGNSTGVPECMAVQRRLKLIVYGLYNKLYIEVSYRTPTHWAELPGHTVLLKNTSAGQMFVDRPWTRIAQSIGGLMTHYVCICIYSTSCASVALYCAFYEFSSPERLHSTAAALPAKQYF